ncbi:MAG: N-acyl-D-glucosamine 2-epimerase [Eubacterium sp.]|nr:N-acyl-D-glucosamine 2-epimerase [Eubacterium sp.]
MDSLLIKNFVNDIEQELQDNILEFDKKHQRASVLFSRILWTYSTAYRFYKDDKYLAMADRAYDYINRYFIDTHYSGVYWLLDYTGNVIDSKKQTYAIAFAIYGMSEYFRATGKAESLETAIQLYNTLEKHVYDSVNKGYMEACSRDWSNLGDMSLSQKDMNSAKSMNTHLHVMEAYTNLFRVWKDESLKNSLEELIKVTIDHIIDPEAFQFKLFFDETWKPLSHTVSFGHDIEGSWLLLEAAEVLGNAALVNKVKDISTNMAKKVFDSGVDRINGGLFYEEDKGELVSDKDWWPQAEAVVGFVNAYQLSGEEFYLEAALNMWNFIKNHIVDKIHGEWFWGTSADGSVVTRNEKVGPWKCPYHNSRMCYEIIDRLTGLKQ